MITVRSLKGGQDGDCLGDGLHPPVTPLILVFTQGRGVADRSSFLGWGWLWA